MNTVINTCCFCGKKYIGYGNSTWGYWQLHGKSKEDDTIDGEHLRCCDNCNLYIVIPARIKLQQLEKNNKD